MANDSTIKTNLATRLPRLCAAGARNATIAAVALVATTFVSVDSLSEARPATPATAFSERFVFDLPDPAADAVDLTAARQEVAAAIARLGAADRVPARHDREVAPSRSRYLTEARPIGAAGSELVRYRVTDLARD
jgi:hypothetical protein